MTDDNLKTRLLRWWRQTFPRPVDPNHFNCHHCGGGPWHNSWAMGQSRNFLCPECTGGF